MKNLHYNYLFLLLLCFFTLQSHVQVHAQDEMTMTFDNGPREPGFRFQGFGAYSGRIYVNFPNVNYTATLTKIEGCFNFISFNKYNFGGGGGTWRVWDNKGREKFFKAGGGNKLTLNWTEVKWVKFKLNDVGNGGTNNAWDIDNIVYSIPVKVPASKPTVSLSQDEVCQGGSATLSFQGQLNDASEWRVYSGSCGGTFVGKTSGNSITVNPSSTTTYYVRGEGLCPLPGECSDPITLTVKTYSTRFTKVVANVELPCPGEEVFLVPDGGTGGTGAKVKWYTGPNGTGTNIPTVKVGPANTPQIKVRPTQTTTYYVRREGDCNTTSDFSYTLVVSNDPSCNKPPVAVCNSITVDVNSSCEVTVNPASLDGGSSDPDGDNLQFSLAKTTYGNGVHNVTLTVSDGGLSDQCTTTITARDITKPVPDLSTLPDVRGECSVTVVTPPTATDACEGTIVGTTSDPLTYSTQGFHKITWTFDDGNGNIETQTQDVVINDITRPIPDLTTLPDVVGECSATVVTVPTATDACEGAIVGTTFDPLTYSTQGTYTITWFFDDGNGNAERQTQTVIVRDVSKPIPDLNSLPDVTGECSATVSSTPTATDNCEGSIIGTTSDALTYSTQGTHTITWSFDDGNGNIETQTQNVVIKDVSKPSPDLATLPDVTGECSATIVTPPTATDNCVGKINGTTSDPLTYSTQGTYNITWSFDDGNGNIETQSQTVIIKDISKPSPSLSSLPDVTGECSATVAATPTAIDNCTGQTITGTTSDPLTYSTQGTHTITWSFDDGNGNIETQTQTVIIDDVTKPVPDVVSLPTISVECSASLQAPTATDNCEGTITGTTSDPLTYSAQGTHTITWSFDDGNGNIETQTQTVIIDDATAPVPNVANLPTVTASCEAGLEPPFATDNCAGQVAGTTSDQLYFNQKGTYTITWVYDDGNGNTTSQDQTIIIGNAIAPVPDRASLPTLRGQCAVTVSSVPTATDGCNSTIQGTTSDPLTYNTQGVHIITWTFDDGNGNIATQTQRVVVRDRQAPVPDQANLPTMRGSCSVMITNFPTATDNCGGSITATTDSPLEFDQDGNYAIVWNYEDGHGNTSSQTQWVVINSGAAPNALCKDISVSLGSSESMTIKAEDIDKGSFDDCSSVTLLVGAQGGLIFNNVAPPAPSMDLYCHNGKVQQLILYVTNEEGETANCQATVTMMGEDKDLDGILDNCDNCPDTYNPNQQDLNNNGKGDICDGNSNPNPNPNPNPGGWEGWSLKQQGSNQDNIITEMRAYPNPFQEEVNLSFSLNQEERTTIEVFNIQGQRVHTLLSEVAPKGEHRVMWDGKDQNGQTMPAGIYLIRLRAGKALINQKVVLQK